MPRSCSLNFYTTSLSARALLPAVADYSVVPAVVRDKWHRLAELLFTGAKAGSAGGIIA